MKVHSPLGPYAPDRPGKLHEEKSFTGDFDRKFFKFVAFWMEAHMGGGER